MTSGTGPSFRRVIRGFATVIFAYLLVIHSLTGTLKSTITDDLSQRGFGAICASSDSHPTPTEPSSGSCPDMPCCVQSGRLQIDVAIEPKTHDLIVPELRLVQERPYTIKHDVFVASKIELTPLQPRAPPTNLV